MGTGAERSSFVGGNLFLNGLRFGARVIRIAAVFATVTLVAVWACYRWWPLPLRAPSLEVIVEPGTLPAKLGASLRDQGVLVPVRAMRWALRLRGDARSIKSGSYEFKSPISLADVLNKLVRNDPQQRELRIVEGWNFRQLRVALNRHPDLSHQTPALSDVEILRSIGAPQAFAEGWFAPDYYLFYPGASDIDLLRRAYRRQTVLLKTAWERRSDHLPLENPLDLLVLASIVEKETAREEDRRKVAAVFANRLRLGMRLQSDPTTIYGMGERFDGDLRRADLRADSPWNTYTRAGLPITPIAMPSRASLDASIAPAQTKALYFVARGDGSSEFNESLDAHNQAVRRWQRRQESP